MTTRRLPRPVLAAMRAAAHSAYAGSLRGRLRREPTRDLIDLLVGIAPGQLRHHRPVAPAAPVFAHPRLQFDPGPAGERRHASRTCAVGPVTTRARCRDVASCVTTVVLRSRESGSKKDERERRDEPPRMNAIGPIFRHPT